MLKKILAWGLSWRKGGALPALAAPEKQRTVQSRLIGDTLYITVNNTINHNRSRAYLSNTSTRLLNNTRRTPKNPQIMRLIAQPPRKKKWYETF